MSSAGWKSFKTYLEMIKIEHSIFALPFAMIGMMFGSIQAHQTAWPGWRIFLLIVLAMVTCRSSAMAFNRILDRDIDAKNPRTKIRALPAGLLQLRTANLYFFGSIVLFLAASALLNPLTLYLSPVALGITLIYSATKRFTPLCHLVLGLSLGLAPAAAWIAVTGVIDWNSLWLVGAVILWTAGFDIIYALQDESFDRENRLRSIPETFGKSKALMISRTMHLSSIILLAAAGYRLELGWAWYVGVVFGGCLLAYEQSLVKPDDLSRVNLAFFTLNGYVSVGVFAFTWVDLVLLK